MRSKILFAISVWLILAIAGCTQSPGGADEAAAVALIQKLGGKVEYEGERAERRVVKVYLHQTRVSDDDLAVLEKLPKLRNLFLGKTKIGDAGLSHLEHADELQTLSLNSTAVTDAGLKSLSELKNLKTINLQETRVTAAGAAQLRKSLPAVKIAR
jgi:hypothetical protein